MNQYKDIKTIEELYMFMKTNIEYGFISSFDKKRYIRKVLDDDNLYEETLFKYYYLQRSDELIISKCGLCYDQVELEREWMTKNGYQVFTYFSSYHNHATLIYENNGAYGLFERTLPNGNNGIYKANSLEECLDIYKNIQFKNAPEDIKVIEIYPYNQVEFGLNFYEFKNFAMKKKEKKVTLRRNS